MKKYITLSKMDRLSIACFLAIFLLSTLVLLFNHYYWHYAAVNYFDKNIFWIVFFSTLLTAGCFAYFGTQSKITQKFFYIAQYFLIVCLVVYATIAVQLTPFPPIDEYLVLADLKLNYDMVGIMHGLYQYPILIKILKHAYNFIDLELALLPLFLILCRQFVSVKRYFFFILFTTLIGFLMYYLWPTMAPASILHSPHFLTEQYNTGRKFYAVHHHIFADSGVGGLISMPSFHIIWAIICQESAWRLRWLWIILLPLNILVILAALFLGWHYFVDLLGSILVVGVVWLLARKIA